MTPAEANQERRDAAIKRGRRIDALDHFQLGNFIHRLAAVEPSLVDRVLDEFDANAPKPRTEPKLHPVIFKPVNAIPSAIRVWCPVCDWGTYLDGESGLPELERLVREHSGITS